MTGVTLLRMPARLAAIASALICAATTLVVTPTATAAPCPDIEVIFARGTDDTPGPGTNGQAFVNALRPQVGGRSLTTYAVNYPRSEEHTSELQSLMRISYAVFCLKTKK